MPLLSVEKLSIDFLMRGSWLPAVSDVSFSLAKGEVLALVGESGCGKSVTCLSLAKLLPEPPARYASGSILLEDKGKTSDVLKLHPRELRKIRGGRIAYIFQEPSVSLNPVFRIGEQIAEAIELHRPELEDIRGEVVALLRQVGISEPERRVDAYPHEMSGGMQQRVMIAMALACKPEILVADEPTTALDVTIQAQILDLLRKLRSETEMAIILVTHNLGLVADLADRVIVMYAGHMVESAPVEKLLSSPLHPYTQALLSAVPKLGQDTEKLTTIPGQVPSPANYPRGCRFYGRCARAEALPEKDQKICAEEPQAWREASPGHGCRCWQLHGEKS
ncbi:MAG: dipeptide/oligopeptide/nickel ABC transporter ATP-binding protein [Lentisphaerae bacterium GWF2_52_8]|nr:MAG: dipeptide/oligopeptide/nickel ABC transporter ATP-binding protein [Lentisphaerae bacterium GWF2_52_8]